MKRTASDLGKDTGIEAKTLSAFINSYIRQANAGEGPGFDAARAELSGIVLMLDEASMVGSEQMNDLVTIANALGVDRPALVGDRGRSRQGVRDRAGGRDQGGADGR